MPLESKEEEQKYTYKAISLLHEYLIEKLKMQTCWPKSISSIYFDSVRK